MTDAEEIRMVEIQLLDHLKRMDGRVSDIGAFILGLEEQTDDGETFRIRFMWTHVAITNLIRNGAVAINIISPELVIGLTLVPESR